MDVNLTAQARRDLRSILVHTQRRWGARQRRIYREEIFAGFARLGDNPELGESRDEFRAGLRAKRVEHHVLYYRILPDSVEILRILHERVEAARYFREPSE